MRRHFPGGHERGKVIWERSLHDGNMFQVRKKSKSSGARLGRERSALSAQKGVIRPGGDVAPLQECFRRTLLAL